MEGSQEYAKYMDMELFFCMLSVKKKLGISSGQGLVNAPGVFKHHPLRCI